MESGRTDIFAIPYNFSGSISLHPHKEIAKEFRGWMGMPGPRSLLGGIPEGIPGVDIPERCGVGMGYTKGVDILGWVYQRGGGVREYTRGDIPDITTPITDI